MGAGLIDRQGQAPRFYDEVMVADRILNRRSRQSAKLLAATTPLVQSCLTEAFILTLSHGSRMMSNACVKRRDWQRPQAVFPNRSGGRS